MIELLFFAQLQEEIGQKSMIVDADNMTVYDIISTFLGDDQIKHLIDDVMIAVNEEYAKSDTVVTAGDVVAFIPPVSGG